MNFFNKIKIFYENDIYKKFSFCVILLFLIAQFSFFIFPFARHAANSAIIEGIDNDGARVIRTVLNTKWYNDNKFYPYGNFYYRIAHTLTILNPLTSNSKLPTFDDINQKSAHFATMLLSVMAIFALSYLISYIITDEKNCRLAIMFLCNIMFFNNHYWTNWILRPHPDILLAFMTALSVYAAFRFLNEKDNKILFVLSALTFGLTLATKLTTVLFIAPTIIFFFQSFKKENFIKAVKYYLFLAGTYFFIGMPQNFMIHRHIKFIIRQSEMSVPGNMESIIRLFKLLISQSWMIILLIIILSIIVGRGKNEKVNTPILIKLLIVILFPFFYLLKNKQIFVHDHYILPIASSMFVLFAIIGNNLSQKFIKLYKKVRFYSIIKEVTPLVCILAGILILNSPIKSQIEKRESNFKEANIVFDKIKFYQKKGIEVLVDPYVPYDYSLNFVNRTFRRTFKDVVPGKTKVIALKGEYYMRYMVDEPTDYMLKTKTGIWPDIQKFYSTFYKNDFAEDPYGQKWKKTYSDRFTWEIWERIE